MSFFADWNSRDVLDVEEEFPNKEKPIGNSRRLLARVSRSRTEEEEGKKELIDESRIDGRFTSDIERLSGNVPHEFLMQAARTMNRYREEKEKEKERERERRK